MKNNCKSVMDFYLLATKLKYKLRSAWDSTHWNITCERKESIAEHIYGTLILSIGIYSEFNIDIDFNKVLKTLVLHEIGEVLIGDITPFDNVTPEEKQNIEHKAMLKVLGDLSNKEELYELLLEFDERKTKEAKFAYLCDKIEADIQAKVYQDMGFHRLLDDQKNNVVFNNSKVQELIDNGAQTAFDIWYSWDKDKYKDDPIFKELFNYVNDNDTNI